MLPIFSSDSQVWRIWPPFWVRLEPNWTILGLFKISFLFILAHRACAHRAKKNRKLILKGLGFVPFGANLSELRAESDKHGFSFEQLSIVHHINTNIWRLDLSLYNTNHLTLRKTAIWMSKNWQKLDFFLFKLPKIFIFKKLKFLAISLHSNGNFPEGQLTTIFSCSQPGMQHSGPKCVRLAFMRQL